MWPFKKKEKLNMETLINDAFEKKLNGAVNENLKLRTQVTSLEMKVQQQDIQIKEQLSKLREQNEADIFLQCEKIKAEILAGKTKEDLTPHLRQLADLQNEAMRYAGMQSGYTRRHALGGLF